MSDPVQKFQNDMKKMGLGVSITSGRRTVEVHSGHGMPDGFSVDTSRLPLHSGHRQLVTKSELAAVLT